MTGKDVQAFWSRITEGATMMCLENTYAPRKEGTTGTVAKLRKTQVLLDTDAGDYCVKIPRRVSDVLEITHDSITYRIVGANGNPGIVTWMFNA